MTAHTPEPWKTERDTYGVTRIWATTAPPISEVVDVATPVGDGSLSAQEQEINAARIVACVNGCAGLNPAAYRSVVEVLRVAKGFIEEDSGVPRDTILARIKDTLTAAQGTQP